MLTSANISPTLVLVIILAMYVITGFFMDSMGVLILTLPILYPTVLALGFDSLWFGVLVVITGETAVVTPPVAVNVYVVHSVAGDIPIGTIIRGIWPFLWVLIAALIIIVIFPQIATFLPGFMTY
jgi:TRAP-type C4-dicarboxylate transport system permease large subunit